jgi:phosphatidylserine/phosphatidylglycerophosphate/cardiolipin synthase-like enzyme
LHARDELPRFASPPKEDGAGFAVRAIGTAERQILVGAYRLTVGPSVVGALIRAKEPGVDVPCHPPIKSTPCGRATGIDRLAAAGVPIWMDDRARIAHAKMTVIDGRAMLMDAWAGSGMADNDRGLRVRDSKSTALLQQPWENNHRKIA